MKWSLSKSKREYESLFSLGKKGNKRLDKVCAFILAICPILQHYVGVVSDAGITLLIAVFPFLFLSFIMHFRVNRKMLLYVTPMLLFILYKTFAHEINVMSIIYGLLMCLYYLMAASGAIDVKLALQYSLRVASVACMIIIVQYIFQYLFHIHLQVVPTGLLLPESQQWVLVVETGFASITGRMGTLYRPSAFFLEPSHMFLYVFPHLLVLLCSPNVTKWALRKAALLTVGLLCTTSGMGIATAAASWLLYFTLRNARTKKIELKSLLNPQKILVFIGISVVLLILVLTVPFLRSSVERILDTSDSGAIAGRTRLAGILLRGMSASQKVFGITSTLAGIDFNMSGFAATLYKFGAIGIVLSYIPFAVALFKTKSPYNWIALVVIIVSFFSAQTHGTFYMMYYMFFLMEGMYVGGKIETNCRGMHLG